MKSNLFATLLTGAALCAACGCSAPLTSNGATDAVPAVTRRWQDEAKCWRYPREDASSLTNEGSDTLVLYQASTADSFFDVCRFYEDVGGVKGFADFGASPGWVQDSTGPHVNVVAVQAGEGYAKGPDERPPNDRSFFIRKPDYAVTAFVRQEPPGTKTRITLIFESARR